MDRLDEFRAIIRSILTEHARAPFSVGELRCETVLDRDADRYVLLVVGRDHERRRVDTPIIHIDIIDGKVWVQCDNTDAGVVEQLLDAGVPKDRIVLGFKAPEVRKFTGFAVA
jgi:hypothetical protein